MTDKTNELNPDHTLPTQSVLFFFGRHTKILNEVLLKNAKWKLRWQPTHNGTFAFAPTLQANPSAKSKEPFLGEYTDKPKWKTTKVLL